MRNFVHNAQKLMLTSRQLRLLQVVEALTCLTVLLFNFFLSTKPTMKIQRCIKYRRSKRVSVDGPENYVYWKFQIIDRV